MVSGFRLLFFNPVILTKKIQSNGFSFSLQSQKVMNVIRKPYSSYYRRRAPYRRRYSSYQRVPRRVGLRLTKYKWALAQQNTFSTVLSRAFTITSDAVGSIQATVAFSGIQSCPGWSNLQTIFDQLRVEAIRIEFTPALPNSTTATFTPMYIAYDADSQTPFPTSGTMLTYASVQRRMLNMPFKYFCTITNDLDSRTTWYDTANPAVQTDTVFMRSDGLSLSQLYGTITVYHYVTFRGQR